MLADQQISSGPERVRQQLVQETPEPGASGAAGEQTETEVRFFFSEFNSFTSRSNWCELCLLLLCSLLAQLLRIDGSGFLLRKLSTVGLKRDHNRSFGSDVENHSIKKTKRHFSINKEQSFLILCFGELDLPLFGLKSLIDRSQAEGQLQELEADF